MISVGTPGNISGNPPYEENETIAYTCATNYILYGPNENVCSGPPDYFWNLTEIDLPTCLRGMNKYNFLPIVHVNVFLLVSFFLI